MCFWQTVKKQTLLSFPKKIHLKDLEYYFFEKSKVSQPIIKGLQNCLSDLSAVSVREDYPEETNQGNETVQNDSIAGSWKLVWTKNSNAFDGLFDEELSKNLMGANAVRANYEIKENTIVYKRYFKTLSKFKLN